MGHNEPPHQVLRCLQIQLFSSLVLKESRDKEAEIIVGRCFLVKQYERINVEKNDIMLNL